MTIVWSSSPHSPSRWQGLGLASSILVGPTPTYFVFVGRGKVGQAVLAFQAWSPRSIAGPGLHGNEK